MLTIVGTRYVLQAILIGVFAFLVVACKPKVLTRDEISSTFNAKAREAFVKKFNQYDLYPMSDTEKCILREGIVSYLDSMNNNKLVILDSFYIREYNFHDLGSFLRLLSRMIRLIFCIGSGFLNTHQMNFMNTSNR